ncbi:oligosaccharide flippase family protein [Faunimonas sp. B44]|uniref:oligosaccharide flippase family protein n=1 Tax=Faunimonas sp. B44 TaxID=3461493 RepID=UPI004044D28E
MSRIDQLRNLVRSENLSLVSRSVVIQVIGYGVSLALMPVAIAFYTPEQFGMFAVALFCANLVGSYGGLKLEWAVINEHSGRAAELLLRVSLTLLLVLGMLAALAAAVVPQALFDRFDLARGAALLAAPVAVVTGFGLFLQAWGIRTRNYEGVYLSRNAVMVSRQAFQIGLGLLWPSVAALLVSEFAARLLGVRIILGRLRKRIALVAPTRLARLIGPLAFRRYGHYSKVALPSSLVDFAMTEGLAVVIVPLYGLEVAGAYWLVQRIFGIPVALIGTVAADVFQGQIARRSDHDQILRQMTQVGALLTAFSVIVLPAAAVVFWLLTRHFYDGKWVLSGQLGLYLVPAICLQFIASPLSRILIVREKMHYKYIFDGTMFLGLASWLTLTTIGGLGVLHSIAYLAGVQALAYSVYIVLCFHIARQAKAGADRRMKPGELGS